jgi:hypothetical protein
LPSASMNCSLRSRPQLVQRCRICRGGPAAE